MTPTFRTIIVADHGSPLKGLLASSSATLVVGEFKRLSQAMQEGPSRRPDLVIADLPEDRTGGPDGPPARMVEALARTFPESAVFVTGPSVSADFVIEVIRAGAVEFLRRPVQEGDLASALEKLLRIRRPTLPAARPGRITSVFSTKGGLGVTTVATNLAVCLAERAPGRTILIDLDTRQSDVATFLNLRPTYSVVDALENPDRLDASFLQGLSSATPAVSWSSRARPASSAVSSSPSRSRSCSRSSALTTTTSYWISGTISTRGPSRRSRPRIPSSSSPV